MSWCAFSGIMFAIFFRPGQGRGKSFDPAEDEKPKPIAEDAATATGQTHPVANINQATLPTEKQAESRGQELQ
jgi:hypothetical protein